LNCAVGRSRDVVISADRPFPPRSIGFYDEGANHSVTICELRAFVRRSSRRPPPPRRDSRFSGSQWNTKFYVLPIGSCSANCERTHAARSFGTTRLPSTHRHGELKQQHGLRTAAAVSLPQKKENTTIKHPLTDRLPSLFFRVVGCELFNRISSQTSTTATSSRCASTSVAYDCVRMRYDRCDVSTTENQEGISVPMWILRHERRKRITHTVFTFAFASDDLRARRNSTSKS